MRERDITTPTACLNKDRTVGLISPLPQKNDGKGRGIREYITTRLDRMSLSLYRFPGTNQSRPERFRLVSVLSRETKAPSCEPLSPILTGRWALTPRSKRFETRTLEVRSGCRCFGACKITDVIFYTTDVANSLNRTNVRANSNSVEFNHVSKKPKCHH